MSVNETAVVEMVDSISVIPRFGAISDLIFIDAPYSDFGLGLLFVKKLTKIAKNGTVLIWEFESNHPTPKIDDAWDIVKDKTYGRARFLFLVKK
jgi:16S rRNA G966 N2-methylase RsmD